MDGEEAQGICKEEWKAFMKHFVDPLMQKAVLERLGREAGESPCYEGRTEGKLYTFQDIVDNYHEKLADAYNGLEAKLWSPKAHVPRECYKPTEVPYFLSIDNAPVHSFWEVYKKVHAIECGTSLLQLIRMPPHGHDLHQIVEHAIGVTKSHAKKKLRELAGLMAHQEFSASMIYDAVQNGAKEFGVMAITNNLFRVKQCIKLVAAPAQVPMTVVDGRGNVMHTVGTGGHFCAPKFS
jgi:hypothetical protein